MTPTEKALREIARLESLNGVLQPLVAVPDGSYPGGKSGAGVYQRLINLIPRHRILISAFAGRCGITRHLRPAEHTIVIDADAAVCEWWDSWRRTRTGRRLEIHHCDSIEWLRHRFGLTEYSAAGSGVALGSRSTRLRSPDAKRRDAAATPEPATSATVAETDGTAGVFVFCDPPYVMIQRSHGKQYACE